MRYLSALYVLLLFLSCTHYVPNEWEAKWEKHENKFKSVVKLMESRQLKLMTDQVSYVIPDSINLRYPCDQIVMKLDDESIGENNSYLFFLDTAQRIFGQNPALVYTTNETRQAIYEKDLAEKVIKIEPNWYFLHN